jgi:hypothetical protein
MHDGANRFLAHGRLPRVYVGHHAVAQAVASDDHPAHATFSLLEEENLKGWQEEEVISRARIRVDDILELRHPR